MTLASVHAGDIVRVNIKGRRFLAFVQETERGAVKIKPIERNINYFRASARQVIEHWRKRA